MIRAYDEYGNIVEDYEKKIREEVIEELVKPLQNRCYVLTNGSMCFYCPMECEHRSEKFRDDAQQLKNQSIHN